MKITYCTRSTVGHATIENHVTIEAETREGLEEAICAVMKEHNASAIAAVKREWRENPASFPGSL